MFVPDQKFEASQESGEPVVVQDKVVAPGAVRGPAGEAERDTVIGETALTTTTASDVASARPALWQVISNLYVPADIPLLCVTASPLWMFVPLQ